jgi:hypothetical protein
VVSLLQVVDYKQAGAAGLLGLVNQVGDAGSGFGWVFRIFSKWFWVGF